MTASAQGLNSTKDGFRFNSTDGSSNCIFNSAPNNGGILVHGNTILNGPQYALTSGLVLTSNDSASSTFDKQVTWFGFPAVNGTGVSAQCANLNTISENIDLSAAGNGKVAVDISSDVSGASFDFFLGNGAYYPTSSTYNTGSGDAIVANGVVSAANTKETFEFDFELLDAAIWGAWTEKSMIESFGFRSNTSDAVFTVSAIRVGTELRQVNVNEAVVVSLNVYPNPATDQLNVAFDAASASSVQLTDLTGKVVDVQTAKVGANTISFDVANVNAGVYFLNISNAAGNTAQKVIIK